MTAPRAPENGSAFQPLVHSGTPGRLLTADDLAARLAVAPSWVRAEARAGRLPSIRLGRYRRFLEADVDEWIAQLRGAR